MRDLINRSLLYLRRLLDLLSNISLHVSKQLGLKNPFIYLGVLLLATALLFLATFFFPPLFPHGYPLSPRGYIYLLLPLSLIGILYTTFICSKIFDAFGLRHWLPIFPIVFILLASLTTLFSMIGVRPFDSQFVLNQVVVLFLLCITLSLYFVCLRLLFPVQYIESKIGFLLHINSVFSILYFASIVILFLWFCFLCSILNIVTLVSASMDPSMQMLILSEPSVEYTEKGSIHNTEGCLPQDAHLSPLGETQEERSNTIPEKGKDQSDLVPSPSEGNLKRATLLGRVKDGMIGVRDSVTDSMRGTGKEFANSAIRYAISVAPEGDPEKGKDLIAQGAQITVGTHEKSFPPERLGIEVPNNDESDVKVSSYQQRVTFLLDEKPSPIEVHCTAPEAFLQTVDRTMYHKESNTTCGAPPWVFSGGRYIAKPLLPKIVCVAFHEREMVHPARLRPILTGGHFPDPSDQQPPSPGTPGSFGPNNSQL